LEWVTPTLYLRGRATHLFTLTEDPGRSTPEQPQGDDDPGDADLPEGTTTATAVRDLPAPALAGDRMEELWAVAKQTRWVDRPIKSDLKPIASILTAGEQLIGCIRLTSPKCTAVVTGEHVYLAAGKPNARGWAELCDSASPRHRVAVDRLKIPVGDIEEPVVSQDGRIVLPIRAHGALLTYKAGDSAPTRLQACVWRAKGR
jgi:hypothetical protein